mmetsp:Transcript_54777/g.141084  ORF Transcript_54777/g.141084 Transcript_54777/m.141084 type:complete len:200 (-) Transcript_54777:798-1397(-)
MATIRLTKRASKRTWCLRPSSRLLPMRAPAFSFERRKAEALASRIRSAMPLTKPSGSFTSSMRPPTRSPRLMSSVATCSSLSVRKAFTIVARSSPASPPRSTARPQSMSTSRSFCSLPSCTRMLPGCMSPCTKRCLKTMAQKASTICVQASFLLFARDRGESTSSSPPPSAAALLASSSDDSGSPSSKLMTSTFAETQG